ncbi:hypothetical protein Pyn_22669 [Prunus yedoensis var. nudiflora]|uniref:Uncharacterized protein n=1 Tax=Prunus yedoensis var. nudiflora TaxID=2094558 RepID=A0A314UDU2_PRUYE|nr:hypothetical protein Pyn_22669 [Prunus yedoensis var. nudiflora]
MVENVEKRDSGFYQAPEQALKSLFYILNVCRQILEPNLHILNLHCVIRFLRLVSNKGTFNAASTFSSSFVSAVSSPSQDTLLGCTGLETNEQLLDFDFEPAMKDNKDSNTATATASNSFNMLITAGVSWFLSVP